MRALFVLAVLAIVHFSLYPWRFHAAGFSRPLTWLGIGGRGDLADIAVNLFFYIIPALLGQWSFATSSKARTARRFSTLLLVVGGLTLLSLTLETLQLAIPTRFANLRDVFCNALGALAGASIAFFLPAPSRLLGAWKLPPQVSSLVIFLAAFITWQAFPFYPHLRLSRLLDLPRPFLHPTWSLTTMADVFFALLLLYLAACRLRLPAFPIACAAALVFPLQSFLRDFEISPARLLAAALALLVAVTLFRPPTRLHYLCLATALSLWILIRQLTPGQFADHPINPFTWLPFAPLIEVSARPASIRILSGKFLLYAGALWLWCQTGLSLRLATIALTALILVTELIQCYLPGRTPETTEVALSLLAALLLYATTPQAKRAHPSPPR